MPSTMLPANVMVWDAPGIEDCGPEWSFHGVPRKAFDLLPGVERERTAEDSGTKFWVKRRLLEPRKREKSGSIVWYCNEPPSAPEGRGQ